LIDNWILNELSLCQKDIFILFDKKNISLIVAKLVKFTREKLSNEYLELVKTCPWNKNVVNTVLFVYQQLLTILHSIIPFITEYLYQEIFEKRILESKIIVIETKKNENLWQIDCILALLRNIRCSQEKSKEFYLELEAHWKDKINNFSNSSIFSEILEKNKIKILEKKDKKFNVFISIKPFGVLWYQKQVEQKELEKQLKFYEKEWQRSKSILENKHFISKAPSEIISEEEKKFTYYYRQKIKTKKLIELIAK
jgi:valyl-tRNA synthetase